MKGSRASEAQKTAPRCNGRKPGRDVPKLDPGPWGGDDYCGRFVRRDAPHRCPSHRGRPITHGRYSVLRNETIGTLIEHFEADPDPLNTLSEVAAARALFVDFIDRYEAYTEALIAWHESFADEERQRKPTQVLDIADAYRLLDTLSKMVERIEKAKAQNAISRPDLLRVMGEMGRVVAHVVPQDELSTEDKLSEIQEKWLAITL